MLLPSLKSFIFSKKAKHLQADNKKHLEECAEIIRAGGIIAFPFNGVYGLFGDTKQIEAADLILKVKNRPEDKTLIQVSLPEFSHELVDFSKVAFDKKSIISLWKDIHALGIILPASPETPRHLVKTHEDYIYPTVLPIWTEYEPLRYMLEHFRKLGGKYLIGTSANKSGEPSHWNYKDLYKDFRYLVHAAVDASFLHLPEVRRKSTSIIDLTGTTPKLYREGNVSREEIQSVLQKYNFPMLERAKHTLIVKKRQ